MNKILTRRNTYLLGTTIAVGIMLFLFTKGSQDGYIIGGIDWRETYRPATLALLGLKNPYGAEVAPGAPFAAAPWALVPLALLAWLPVDWGRSFMFFISIIAFSFTIIRLGAKPVTLVAFILSPPVLHCLLNSNIEWLSLLGILLPPRIGLFFITIKPQTSFGLAIYWLIDAWRKGGIRLVLSTFLPISLAFFLSFLLFGLWPVQSSRVLDIGWSFNASLWPASIPVGIVLIVKSIRSHRKDMALGASPWLSPYALFHSWVGALVPLANEPIEMVAGTIGLWILVLIRLISS